MNARRTHARGEFGLTLYSEEEGKSFRVPNICSFFYNAIFPYLVALQFGGAFPWKKIKTFSPPSGPSKSYDRNRKSQK